MEEKSLAYELLQEVKDSNARLFGICIAEAIIFVIIIAGMIIGFFWYESQYNYADETYTQETHDVEASDIIQTIN